MSFAAVFVFSSIFGHQNPGSGLDPDSLEMLDPNPYQDPDSMNEFYESVSTTLTSDPLFHIAD